jgi:hypothetical protein
MSLPNFHTCQSNCFHQGTHSSGAYPFQVGFLDHSQQGFLCWLTRLKQTGEVIPLPQFADRQFDLSNPRIPGTFPVAVVVIASLRRALMLASAYLLLDFHFHQHLTEQLSAFAKKFGVIIQSYFGKILFHFCNRRLEYNWTSHLVPPFCVLDNLWKHRMTFFVNRFYTTL